MDKPSHSEQKHLRVLKSKQNIWAALCVNEKQCHWTVNKNQYREFASTLIGELEENKEDAMIYGPFQF